MRETRRWAAIYLILYLAMLAVNYLSSMNVGNVADESKTLIQPAGYAFSIWGLIYLLLGIWIIKLFMVKSTAGSQHHLTFWPALNFIINGLWIYVFSNGFKGLSVIVIAALLVTLIVMYRKVSNHQYNGFDRFVFSSYFGWVTVATIVNIFTWVKSMSVTSVLGLSELSWGNMMLVVALALAVYIAFKYHDFVYPLIFIWAYSAIIIETDGNYQLLTTVLIISLIALAVTALIIVVKQLKQRT